MRATSMLSESIRWQVLKTGFAYFPEMTTYNQQALFAASQVFYISKRVHLIRYPDAYGKNTPIRSYVNFSYVGKSSYVFEVTWIDNTTGNPIAQFVMKVVLVNKQTRKPVPLSKMFFAGLESHLNTTHRLTMKRMVELPIPDVAFKYETRALHNDTDMNGHVNQGTFYSWSSDAASTAVIQGYLKHFSRHIELYPYKSIRVEHPGEVMVNDFVTVFVWEEDNVRCINVVITVKGKTVFIMKIDFQEGEPLVVSPHLESHL